MHRHCSRRSLATGVFALGLLGSVTQAAAQDPDHPVRQMHDRIDATRDPDEPEGRDFGNQLLIVPLPISNPTLGTGLTLAGGLFYNPNDSREPWITGAGIMHTSNGSRAAGLVHKMTFGGDRFRVTGFVGAADINMNFYGIGPDAGARDRSIGLEESGWAAMLLGQGRVAEDLYAGARLQFLDVNTSIVREEPLFPDLDIPRPQFNTRLVSTGPVLSYDTRDSSLNPQRGELVSAAWMFSLPGLGSDFEYNKFTLAGNVYRPVGRGGVIAARASVCAVSDGGPFYDLCMYGSSSDLRGYETGRYRDRASWAMQVEARQHLFGRFGVVAFAGIGGTAPGLGSLDDTEFLPSVGLGLR